MRKFGFKLFSTNLQNAPALISECADFAAKKNDMFIELMVVPSSTEADFLEIKKQVGNVEVRIHAPHHILGFDAGNKELEIKNRKIFEKVSSVADMFNAKTIVVHAGCQHGKEYLKETARQFNLFNDVRIVVENLPFIDDGDGRELQGSTANEIKFIQEESG